MRKPDWLQSVEHKLPMALRVLSWSIVMALFASCSPLTTKANVVEQYLTVRANAGTTFDGTDFKFGITSDVDSPVDNRVLNYNVNGVEISQNVNKGVSNNSLTSEYISNDPTTHVVKSFTVEMSNGRCVDYDASIEGILASCLILK